MSFKIGLIGCGHVAASSHLPAIQTTKGLTLHAIFDPDVSRLESMRERFHPLHAVRTMQDFLKTGIDAVVITSPATHHCQNVLDTACLGIPILCEKPLAMTPAEASKMIAATKRTNAPLYTAFCYRFSPVALQIRTLLREKAIGETRSLRLIYNWDLHGKYERSPDVSTGGTKELQQRRHLRMLEGGPLIDCGTHQIDLAQFWLESPVKQIAAHGAWVEAYEAPDHLWAHLDHANGAHTLVEVSFSYHQVSKEPRREFVYELIGTEGVIRYDRGERSFTIDTSEGREMLPFSGEKNFQGMYEEFANFLKTGKTDILPTGEEGMRVTTIAEEATRLAIHGRLCIPV